MSVKEPYDSGWKDKVRTRIRRSHGVVALVGTNSLKSSGQKWEIQCAKENSRKYQYRNVFRDLARDRSLHCQPVGLDLDRRHPVVPDSNAFLAELTRTTLPSPPRSWAT